MYSAAQNDSTYSTQHPHQYHRSTCVQKRARGSIYNNNVIKLCTGSHDYAYYALGRVRSSVRVYVTMVSRADAKTLI